MVLNVVRVVNLLVVRSIASNVYAEELYRANTKFDGAPAVALGRAYK